jgi:hypothetical protein
MCTSFTCLCVPMFQDSQFHATFLVLVGRPRVVSLTTHAHTGLTWRRRILDCKLGRRELLTSSLLGQFGTSFSNSYCISPPSDPLGSFHVASAVDPACDGSWQEWMTIVCLRSRLQVTTVVADSSSLFLVFFFEEGGFIFDTHSNEAIANCLLFFSQLLSGLV